MNRLISAFTSCLCDKYTEISLADSFIHVQDITIVGNIYAKISTDLTRN